MDLTNTGVLASNIRRIGRIDVPGGGQVTVEGDLCFIGHMAPPNGTSIVDVSDPTRPRLLVTTEISPASHSHKVRVSGNVMLTNSENYKRHQKTAGVTLPKVRGELAAKLGREPTVDELATAIGHKPEEIPGLLAAAGQEYDEGGLRIWDVSQPSRPREIAFFKTGGNGVHRFDFDGRYAYISTRLDGYHGNIVMIVDVADPTRPREVSRWWLPGQWIAGGETPTWGDLRFECHHPLRFGDRLYVSYHAGGVVILDISDVSRPQMVSHYNYHPPFVCSSHTYARMPFPLGGRDVAVVVDEQPGRARHGQIPGFVWVFDVTDEAAPTPISTFTMSPDDTPYKFQGFGTNDRFGAHQCHEKMRDSLVYLTWFRGGLRVVDIADPTRPVEVGYFIPTPGADQPTVQSNDVFVDDRGLIYLIDRLNGLEILEYTGPAGSKQT